MSSLEGKPQFAVSIILAAYNAGRYLKALTRQLANLEFENYELIVVNDGSTDGSADGLRLLAQRHKNSQYIGLAANGGVARARNEGLARSRGVYIWFIDSDDVWEPTIVGALYTAVERSGAAIAIGGADLISPSGRQLRTLEAFRAGRTVEGRVLAEHVLLGTVKGYLWNKLFHRDLLGVAPFPLITSQSDLAAFIGLLRRIDRAVIVPDCLYHHVAQQGSITTSKNPNLLNIVYCGDRMQEVLNCIGIPRTSIAARYFMTRMIHYAVCNTAFRLSDMNPKDVEFVKRTRLQIGASDVCAVTAVSIQSGLAVALLRYWPTAYCRLLDWRWRRLRRRQSVADGSTVVATGIADSAA